jgi:hypothetical protein
MLVHYRAASCRRRYTLGISSKKNWETFLKNKSQSAVFAFVSGSIRIKLTHGTDLCSWLVYVKTNYLGCTVLYSAQRHNNTVLPP